MIGEKTQHWSAEKHNQTLGKEQNQHVEQPDHQQKEEERQHTTPTEQLWPIREEEEEEEEGETASERSSSSSSSSQSSSARTNHRDTLLTKHPATAPLTAWQEQEGEELTDYRYAHC